MFMAGSKKFWKYASYQELEYRGGDRPGWLFVSLKLDSRRA